MKRRILHSHKALSYLSTWSGHSHDEHVLGHPSFVLGDVRSDAKSEAFLAQEGIATCIRN